MLAAPVFSIGLPTLRPVEYVGSGWKPAAALSTDACPRLANWAIRSPSSAPRRAKASTLSPTSCSTPTTPSPTKLAPGAITRAAEPGMPAAPSGHAGHHAHQLSSTPQGLSVWTRRSGLHPAASRGRPADRSGPSSLAVFSRLSSRCGQPLSDGSRQAARCNGGDKVALLLPDNWLRLLLHDGLWHRCSIRARSSLAADPSALPLHPECSKTPATSARAVALIADRVIASPSALNGKAFIPLLSALAPAPCPPSWPRAPSRTSADTHCHHPLSRPS